MNSKVLILCFLIKLAQAYFDVQMDRFEILKQDTKCVDFSSLKVRKVAKTRSLVGEMKLFIPFGNDIIVEGKAYKKQGGEYRLMPYRFEPTPFCDFCAKDEYLYQDLAKGSELPADLTNNCPIQPGTYKVHNVTFALKNFPKTILPSGDYATEMILEKSGEIFLKYRVYVTIVSVL